MTNEQMLCCQQVLDRHLKAENDHDVEAILATFSEKAVMHWGGRQYQGREAIRKLHDGMGFGDSGAFSQLTVVELKRHYTADAIIIEQELRGVHTGTFEGIAATQRSVTAPVCTVYEFDEEGLLLSERPHLDRLVLLKQIR